MGSDRILKRFWDYVQLPAKTACVLPFLLALFYTALIYHRIDAQNTVLFFVSAFAFELSITGLNNYQDSKGNGAALPFTRKTAFRLLLILWFIAAVAAALLAVRTGLVVLVCGGACFFVGIVYSFGPAPISRMPLGELFSGIFEGFFIPFLVVYINAPANALVWYSFDGWVLNAGFDLLNLFRLAVLTLPAIFGIAGIMLANNICDTEADVKVRRYTLPYYIGQKYALLLFSLLYLLAYLSIAAMAIFSTLPAYCLIALPGMIPVFRNVAVFRRYQSKQKTFPLSISNFLILLLPLIAIEAALLVF